MAYGIVFPSRKCEFATEVSGTKRLHFPYREISGQMEAG